MLRLNNTHKHIIYRRPGVHISPVASFSASRRLGMPEKYENAIQAKYQVFQGTMDFFSYATRFVVPATSFVAHINMRRKKTINRKEEVTLAIVMTINPLTSAKKRQKGTVSMRNKLLNADCRNLGFLEPESIQLVFSSPPYFDCKDYGYAEQIGFGQSFLEYLSNMIQVFRELERLIIPGGKLVINSGTYTITRKKSIWDVRQEVNLPGIFSNLIERHTSLRRESHHIWHKVSGLSYRGKPYPCQVCQHFDIEYVHVFHKAGERQVDDDIRERSRLTDEEFKNLAANVWYIHRKREIKNTDYHIHPCPFPPLLAEHVIKLYSYVGDVVLDPFCGLGNTCIAAARNERDFLGIDMNIDYLFEAKMRIAEMVGMEPTVIEANSKKEGETR